MSVCMTKSNKFEHLEITETFLSFDKIGKFGTLKDTIIGFKLEGKITCQKSCLFTRVSYRFWGPVHTGTIPCHSV